MSLTRPSPQAFTTGTYPSGSAANMTGNTPDLGADIGGVNLLFARIDTPTAPNFGGTQVADEFDDATGIGSLGSGVVASGYLSDVAVTTTATPHTAAGATTNGGYCMLDTAFTLANNTVVTKVGIYSTAAMAGLKIVLLKWNGGTSFDFVQGQAAYNHTGAGWEDVTLSSPYTVPASGNYIAAVFCPAGAGITTTSDVVAGGYYLHAEPTSGNYTFTAFSTANNIFILRYTTKSSPANITTISTAYAAIFAPSTITLVGEWRDISTTAVLNTDIVFSVSRDGGTTWTNVTMTSLGASLVSGALVIKGSVSVAGQPSGTSIKWKVATLNTKEQRLYGLWMSWK